MRSPPFFGLCRPSFARPRRSSRSRRRARRRIGEGTGEERAGERAEFRRRRRESAAEFGAGPRGKRGRSTRSRGKNSAGPPAARLDSRGDRPPRPPSCFPRAPHSGDDGTAVRPAPSIAPRERLWTTLGITLGQSRQVCGSFRHFMWITRWTEPRAALSPGEMKNFRSKPYVRVRRPGTFPKSSARGRGQNASEPLRWVACQPT
jgi:hypothetical protein